MENKYYTVVTDLGTKKMVKALEEGKRLNITEFAVGDGGGRFYAPTTDAVELKNEVWRGEISACYISDESENILIIESTIPSDIGGFTIREMGIYDDSGDMIAICNTPDTVKVRISDGVVQGLALSLEVALSNADSVELIVDQNVVTATKKDIESLKKKIKEVEEKAENTDNMKSNFSEASERENIEAEDTMGVIFGKIKKWFADLKAAAFATVANNLITTEEGSVLDARQGKVLDEKIDQINSNLGGLGNIAIVDIIDVKFERELNASPTVNITKSTNFDCTGCKVATCIIRHNLPMCFNSFVYNITDDGMSITASMNLLTNTSYNPSQETTVYVDFKFIFYKMITIDAPGS